MPVTEGCFGKRIHKVITLCQRPNIVDTGTDSG